ncbi:MAG: hypothetical protein A2096_15780 [Spirochaetes bacterium GWF1_41_5]|nr:MAG: hypothetical protein A2096_15780 [Spirochaetes bacterium GWF1_41_5]
MFGIGFSEIIIIGIVILIFVNPADLPSFLRKAGKLYGEITGTYHSFLRLLRNIENSDYIPPPAAPAQKEETVMPKVKRKNVQAKKKLKTKTM